MEDGKFLARGITEDVAITLIFREDRAQALAKDTSTPMGPVSMDQLQDGNSVPVAFSDLDQETPLGLLQRGKAILDDDCSKGHGPGITPR